MGSWQAEVAKMFLYVMFPVAVFHCYNQPEIFENWAQQTKNKYFQPSSPDDFKELYEYFEKKKQNDKNNSDLL